MAKSHVLPFKAADFQEKILEWYVHNHRVLPWRVVGNKKTDPYKVWLSEIMLQQTTVPAVIPYFLKFTERWPTVVDLANADDADVMTAWAGLGYYARARNLLKCARVVAHDLKGKFPKDMEGLLALPGVGPYTAAAVSAIAYGLPETVVDGNIERITSRIFAVSTPYPEGKKEVHAKAHHLFEEVGKRDAVQIKAYPQALMDIGANICTPKSPLCHVCPVKQFCKAFAEGNAENYPVKAPKKSVPVRKGDVYWVGDGKGNVIFERRADNRMLGGMVGLPTSDWDKSGVDLADFCQKLDALREIGKVYHVFTHFKLELTVWDVSMPDCQNMVEYADNMFVSNTNQVSLDQIGLPTVFLKAAKLAQNFSKVKK